MKNGYCTVYGLYDVSGNLRYIGQTHCSLYKRLKYFRKQINGKHYTGKHLSPVELWISDCYTREDPVIIRAIDCNATWDVSEIIYIERARAAGAELLNVLPGGSSKRRYSACEAILTKINII